MSELKKIFKSINKSNSVSRDMISMKTVSRLKNATLPLTLHLINTVIKTEVFPNCLKFSRILPIRKSNELDPLNASSFRPINLISPFSKLIEKTWSNQILKHMYENQMIDENHYGGLKNRSSTLAVMDIFQKLCREKK